MTQPARAPSATATAIAAGQSYAGVASADAMWLAIRGSKNSYPAQAPKSANATRGSGATDCPCPWDRGRSSKAESAGLRVRELNALMMVLVAIVNANCRKNWPMIPEMNAQGTNTAE